MSACDTAMRKLRNSLGQEYTICTIDLEPVIYRDFGNGFNVEISNVHTTSSKKLANLYLWHGEEQPECIVAKSVFGVKRDDIGKIAEELYAYSEQLIRDGHDNWEDIMELRESVRLNR